MSRENLNHHDKKGISIDCGGVPDSVQPGAGKQKRRMIYVEPASYFPKDIDEKYFGTKKDDGHKESGT